MRAGAIALALAILVPSASVLAAPAASGPVKAQAEAGAKKQAETEKKAAPKPVVLTPAQQKKLAARLASLRQGCYGGVTEKATPLASQVRNRELIEATRMQDRDRAKQAAKDVLQGGDEHPAVVNVYSQALAASHDPADRKAVQACNELLELIFPDEGPMPLPGLPNGLPIK